MRSLTWEQVRRRRLARAFLLEPAPPERLVDVVRAVGGIQAQVLGAAELGIAVRVASVTRRDVQAELWERRRLVKTWSLRGTLHLHPADELSLWMAARRAVTGFRDGRWHEDEGLTKARARAVLEAIGEALDGRCLLREELAEEVARRVGAWAREPLSSAWGHLIGPAVRTGRLCHGPPRGAKITFVRADQWLGGFRDDVDLDAALDDVARRYLGAFGPATPEDLVQWFVAPYFGRTEARRIFERLRPELEEVGVEGRRAFLLAADADEAGAPRPEGPPRLLPEYDAYVLGFRERERFIPDAARARIRAHPKGRFEGPACVPLLIVDGVVAGLWERRRRGKQVEIRVEPLAPLAARRRRAVETEAARIARFLGAELSLSFGDVRRLAR